MRSWVGTVSYRGIKSVEMSNGDLGVNRGSDSVAGPMAHMCAKYQWARIKTGEEKKSGYKSLSRWSHVALDLPEPKSCP